MRSSESAAGIPREKLNSRTTRRGDSQGGRESGIAGAVVGILGGMGPTATADFYQKLVRATPAEVDQDHIQTLIWSDPKIPDRTQALLDEGEDPIPALIAGAQRLEAAGATMLAVPCNTAHYFLPRVQQAVSIPIVHMIEETVRHIVGNYPKVNEVGLLATTGTVSAQLYPTWLQAHEIHLVQPSLEMQVRVMAAIRRVKSGDVSIAVQQEFREIAEGLVQGGAKVIIAGCTEVPLGLAPSDLLVPLIDPAQILAESIVRRVLG